MTLDEVDAAGWTVATLLVSAELMPYLFADRPPGCKVVKGLPADARFVTCCRVEDGFRFFVWSAEYDLVGKDDRIPEVTVQFTSG